jgi:hypothetical protein
MLATSALFWGVTQHNDSSVRIFRYKLLVPSSRAKKSKSKKDGLISYTETSVKPRISQKSAHVILCCWALLDKLIFAHPHVMPYCVRRVPPLITHLCSLNPVHTRFRPVSLRVVSPLPCCRACHPHLTQASVRCGMRPCCSNLSYASESSLCFIKYKYLCFSCFSLSLCIFSLLIF